MWRLALLLLAAAEEWEPASIGADLACSGCELFVEQYLSKCSHYVYGAGKKEVEGGQSVLKVYQERMFSVYGEHEPAMTRGKKRKKVEAIIAREVKKGLFPARRIHEVYVKVCEKYGIEPEEIYEGLQPTGSMEERKLKLTEAALNATLKHVKAKDVQWAISGNEPNRKFIDFNKAMTDGTADSISSGGDIADKLEKVFTYLARLYNQTLTVREYLPNMPLLEKKCLVSCRIFSYLVALRASSG